MSQRTHQENSLVRLDGYVHRADVRWRENVHVFSNIASATGRFPPLELTENKAL
jgi:hypothetical protein